MVLAKGSQEVTVKVWPGLQSSQGMTGAEGSLTCVIANTLQPLEDCLLVASLSSLPCGPFHRAAHNLAAGFFQSEEQVSHGGRKRVNKMQTTGPFYQLACVTSALLIRKESLNLAHTQG